MESETGAGLPLVAVGIPTFNREWSLPQMLEAMLKLDYDKKRMRICFVDNHSSDGTMDILRGFQRAHEGEYEGILIKIEASNIPQARNEVIRLAQGTDYVFFLDSDVIAPPETMRRLLSDFERYNSVAIASVPFETNAPRRTGPLEKAFASPPGSRLAYKVGTGCCFVSMRAVAKVGSYNEKLPVHEDSEYCYRLRRAGFKIVCDGTLLGTHLRRYELGPGYYLRFMGDSARTYRALIARGSVAHMAKVASSVALFVSFLYALVLPSVGSVLLFGALVVFAAALNSSALVLDDGIHVRPAYRPVIGFLLTLATLGISGLAIFGFIFRRK